ncbi:hypothetical protein KCP69_01240 [Salmonella enterica subsp. enterica]|nr:hypothetical protein KCP69_01240 [Salmonella enterica subsp. enterica]
MTTRVLTAQLVPLRVNATNCAPSKENVIAGRPIPGRYRRRTTVIVARRAYRRAAGEQPATPRSHCGRCICQLAELFKTQVWAQVLKLWSFKLRRVFIPPASFSAG